MPDPALVQYTDNGDGSADFTITIGEDDHKFSAAVGGKGDTAIVEYEETLSWWGQLRVSEPDEKVFRALAVSDEMTAFLEEYGLTDVKRIKRA